jgi:hypothetical protein
VKSAEGWQESDWTDRRVAGRIDLMNNHLPPFMVRSARLYSILSLGIHELKEKDCLQFFEVARTSILAILEQEQTMKEQEAALEAAERAIRQYQPPVG